MEATLHLEKVTVEIDEGVYFCVVSNRRDSVRSDNVSLAICKYMIVPVYNMHSYTVLERKRERSRENCQDNEEVLWFIIRQ